jgi:hypothetical protein
VTSSTLDSVGQRPKAAAQRLRGAHDQTGELVAGGGAGLERAAAGHAQRADGLHAAIAPLGGACGRASQRGPCRCLGVDGIGLALAAAGAPIGPVDLHNGQVLLAQVAQQPGAVGPGALDADALQLPEGPQPSKQRAIA